jgi:hypothetical protein
MDHICVKNIPDLFQQVIHDFLLFKAYQSSMLFINVRFSLCSALNSANPQSVLVIIFSPLLFSIRQRFTAEARLILAHFSTAKLDYLEQSRIFEEIPSHRHCMTRKRRRLRTPLRLVPCREKIIWGCARRVRKKTSSLRFKSELLSE